MMDLVHLKSFAEVAERGTIAAAAAAQGYTAPAVSQHIAKLEKALGTQLFDRVGGRVALTAAGNTLLPIAFEMLDLDARGRATVREPGDLPHVVFSGFASAISTVLVPRLSRLRDHATIEITEAEDTEALRDLGLGAVDVALTQEYEGVPAERNRRFTFTPLVGDRLTLVLPPDMAPSTTIGQLRDTPWLLNGRTTRCALATKGILDAAGITPRIVATIADNATLLALVSAGQGVTVVPARVLDDARHDVTIALQDLGITRTIHAVTRTATTATVSQLLDLLVQAPSECPVAHSAHPRGSRIG
ncbi:MAG: LysR family transcriptional regulator [Acidimicrobiales bacterium]